MCSDKTYINKSYCELYYSNDTICISFDIKHIPLVSYAIYGIEGLLYVGIARPMAVFHDIYPYLQWK